MSLRWCLKYYLFLLSSFNTVWSVPPDHCFTPLNQSDCNQTPTYVFTYWQPGSRCEQALWRGCPSLNKFPNEYVCSMNCIFRKKVVIHNDEPEPYYLDECEAPINYKVCSQELKIAYRNDNGTCVEFLWGGCQSQNTFANKERCEAVCKRDPGILEQLDQEPLEEIQEILNNIIEEVITTTEAEEAETTTEAEPETTTESEEETTTEAEIETTTNDDYEEVVNA